MGASGGQCDGRDDLAEEELAARPGYDQLVVAPHPAQSGAAGPVAFEHGGCVAAYAGGLCLLAVGPRRQAACLGSLPLYVGREAAEAALHRVMVVAPVGIGRQLELPFWHLPRRSIGQGHAHNAACAGQEQARVEAQVGVAGHVVHAGVAALAQPLRERLGRPAAYCTRLGHSASKKPRRVASALMFALSRCSVESLELISLFL